MKTVDEIETSVRLGWRTELQARRHDSKFTDADMFPLLVRDLARSIARIAILEVEVARLQAETGRCR